MAIEKSAQNYYEDLLNSQGISRGTYVEYDGLLYIVSNIMANPDGLTTCKETYDNLGSCYKVTQVRETPYTVSILLIDCMTGFQKHVIGIDPNTSKITVKPIELEKLKEYRDKIERQLDLVNSILKEKDPDLKLKFKGHETVVPLKHVKKVSTYYNITSWAKVKGKLLDIQNNKGDTKPTYIFVSPKTYSLLGSSHDDGLFDNNYYANSVYKGSFCSVYIMEIGGLEEGEARFIVMDDGFDRVKAFEEYRRLG